VIEGCLLDTATSSDGMPAIASAEDEMELAVRTPSR